MVRIVNSMNMVKGEDFPVKVEFEDSLEEEHGPLNKRSRVLAFQQWNNETSTTASQPMLYNPLAESPIGLRLRKSPSLLELIQMRLSQGSGVTTSELNGAEDKDKDSKNMAVFGSADKLKASNFPASLLRIGSWESVSRYEGDLVAKCYFAKHKLVWEVLDGGLKSKIEIQWSDITSLKAYCPEAGNSTLDIVLARQPLFFRETNPQPRKHTLWQATSDFTGGQASINRRHFLQVPQGLLKKHFDKLIQCDPRLYLLSQKEEITLESPYFEHRVSIFEEPDDPTTCGYDQLKYEHLPPSFSGFQESPSPHVVQTSTPNNDLVDPVGRITGTVSQETPSPSSVMDSRAIEEHVTNESNVVKDTSVWNQFRVPGLSASMSKNDLVSHLEHCISEHVSSGNAPRFTSEGPWNKNLLDDIAEHLLSDFQTPLPSDEKSLMTRVNSLYSLLQKDTGTVDPVKDESSSDDDDFSDDDTLGSPVPGFSRRPFFPSSATEEDPTGNKQAASMSRKDSVGDLLLNLPRIASLPQFLFNMPDDADNRAR